MYGGVSERMMISWIFDVDDFVFFRAVFVFMELLVLLFEMDGVLELVEFCSGMLFWSAVVGSAFCLFVDWLCVMVVGVFVDGVMFELFGCWVVVWERVVEKEWDVVCGNYVEVLVLVGVVVGVDVVALSAFALFKVEWLVVYFLDLWDLFELVFGGIVVLDEFVDVMGMVIVCLMVLYYFVFVRIVMSDWLLLFSVESRVWGGVWGECLFG